MEIFVGSTRIKRILQQRILDAFLISELGFYEFTVTSRTRNKLISSGNEILILKG